MPRLPDPTDEEIREYLSGNVCRCTGYVRDRRHRERRCAAPRGSTA
ncbi:MAG: 2Fe-2S iron-sulfur cluster-binding protein [Solirubrobacterales bacterium]